MERELRQKLPGGKFQDVSATRSKAMAAVRGKGNKTTEQRLRMAMVQGRLAGWTLHPKDILGRPDFFFSKVQLAVFVDGCFWHGCPACGHVPKTNNEYWQEKITRNQERDRKTTERLTSLGINVVRFWEHELAADLPACIMKIRAALTSGLTATQHL